MTKYTKEERRKLFLERIEQAKGKDFEIKKISYDSPLDCIRKTAPTLLKYYR